jgi:hypothetical protein
VHQRTGEGKGRDVSGGAGGARRGMRDPAPRGPCSRQSSRDRLSERLRQAVAPDRARCRVMAAPRFQHHAPRKHSSEVYLST